MAIYLLPVVAFLVVSLPTFLILLAYHYLNSSSMHFPLLFIAPALFVVLHVLTASMLSLLGRSAIIKGTFPRDLRHPIYGRRRIYGFCWNAIYYFSAIYFLCLSFSKTRNMLFYFFGYKGSNDISISPDTWLRDLPLLNFGKKAYIANRATIGTNMCLSNGKVIVDQVEVGESAMVGHLCLVGPGSSMAPKSELGVNTALGIKARLEEGARTAICVTIFHAVNIGTKTEVGACSYIGLRAKIGSNLKIPAGSNIPAGSIINTQEEMNAYYSSETKLLNASRIEIVKTFLSTSENESPYNEDA